MSNKHSPITLSSNGLRISKDWKGTKTRTAIVGASVIRNCWDEFGKVFGNKSRTAYINKFIEAFMKDNALMAKFVEEATDEVYDGWGQYVGDYGDFYTTVQVDREQYNMFVEELRFAIMRNLNARKLTGSEVLKFDIRKQYLGGDPISWIVCYMVSNAPVVRMVIPANAA